MVLRLDPTILAVWRTPTSLQFGIDPAIVVLEEIGAPAERMIAALEIGTTGRALEVIGGADAAADLLQRLSGIVLDAPAVAVPHRVELRIRSTAIDTVRAQLGMLGIRTDAPGIADTGLLVVDHVAAPAEYRAWLRDDRPHLAVILGERSIVVGPLVRPGRTACLRCRDLHRHDADPAWAAIATQLLHRPAASSADPVLLAAALTAAMTALERGAGDGADTAVRIDARGGRHLESVAPHPSCGCFGLVD